MADLIPMAIKSLPKWMSNETDHVNSILPSAFDAPSQRERWKYTKLRQVQEVATTTHQIDWSQLPSGVTHKLVDVDKALPSPLMSAAEVESQIWRAPDVFVGLCKNQTVDYLDVAAGQLQTIDIRHTGPCRPIFINISVNAKVELTECFAQDIAEFSNQVWIHMQPGSRLVHSRNIFLPTTARAYSYLQVTLQEDCNYSLHSHNAGLALNRQDIHILCQGAGAHANVDSASFIPEKCHLDQHCVVQHQAPYSSSQQTLHNIAADQGQVTFNGRIHIHPKCPGVTAHLTNRNLGLGAQANINTKPELEIYTDDVQCSHGATVGKLDPDHLFYFASRGIDETTAMGYLAKAFLNACIGGPMAASAREHLSQLSSMQVSA